MITTIIVKIIAEISRKQLAGALSKSNLHVDKNRQKHCDMHYVY